MLKITTIKTQGQRKLVLEGKLVQPWIAELKRAWQEAREPHDGRKLVIELVNVTVISCEGEEALFEMMREGARFSCRGALNRHVLRQLARRCKHWPKQQNRD